jgi:adenylate kinase
MQTPLGIKVKTTLAEIKAKMVEEALVIFEAEKKKKKPPKG